MSYLYFAENRLIPTEVRKDALELQKLLEFDDEGGEGELISSYMLVSEVCFAEIWVPPSYCLGVSSHMDDEYKWAGVEDPKIMVTTSRDPSSRLKMFSKVCYTTYIYFLNSLC